MSKQRAALYALAMCALVLSASASATMTIVAVDSRIQTGSYNQITLKTPKAARCRDCRPAASDSTVVLGD
jgi:hypothetical protein